MKTPSEAQFSHTFNTAEGGLLLIYPDGSADLGTSGRIEIAPQPGPATDVTVSARLFGLPGEADDTTGGNVCIGQGIEWAVSEPDAIEAMRVTFVEAAFLTEGGRAEDAIAYKDGVPIEESPRGSGPGYAEASASYRRTTSSDGMWEITSSSMGATEGADLGTGPGHFSASAGSSGIAPIQLGWHRTYSDVLRRQAIASGLAACFMHPKLVKLATTDLATDAVVIPCGHLLGT